MKILTAILLFISANVFAYSPADRDGDGMPDKYELNNKLKIDINDTYEDPDNDGFSNIEEYCAQTDPQSSKSHPDLAIKHLKIKKFLEKVYPCKFVKLERKGNNKQNWLIHISLDGQSNVKKLGDIVKIEDDNYKIIDVIYKTGERFSKKLNRPVPANFSEIILRNETDKKNELKAIIGKDIYIKPEVVLVDSSQNEFTKSNHEEITIGSKLLGFEKYTVILILPKYGCIRIKKDSGKEYEIKIAQPKPSGNR